MDGHVTRTQFARIYGCSKPYVTKLVAEKRVVLSEDGALINVEASLRLLDVTSDPSKAAVRTRWEEYRTGIRNTPPAAEGGMAAAAGESTVDSPASSTPAASTRSPVSKPAADKSAYHLARTKREEAVAELATMKLKEAMRQLVDATSTLRAFVDVQTVARNEVLSLADRLTPLVTPEMDARKVYDMIRTETERTCETIANKVSALSAALTVAA